MLKLNHKLFQKKYYSKSVHSYAIWLMHIFLIFERFVCLSVESYLRNVTLYVEKDVKGFIMVTCFQITNTRFCNRIIYTFGATVIFHIFTPLMYSKKKQRPDLEEINTLYELEFSKVSHPKVPFSFRQSIL